MTDQPHQRHLKLELTWVGKDNRRPLLEPRILLYDDTRSYHAATRKAGDHFDNLLIFGDNLLALKALTTDPQYRGQVKCIFIDPPYNTGSAFEHYDDGLEHSLWLGMMRERLELLRDLLTEDGSIWISIDDNEAHYLKVLCDEIFGRRNFVSNVIWQKKFAPQNDDKGITSSHDHILVYALDKQKFTINLLSRSEDDDRYKNPDNDPKGAWSSGDLTSKTKAKGHSYPITSPSGEIFYPPQGRQWAPSESTFMRWLEEGRIWFGENGKNRPRLKQYLSEVQQGIVPVSIWMRDDVGDNQEAKREVKGLVPDDIFETPKPERLLQRIIHLATNPNDLVLDSFAGSGTTGAVAHKMGRRWVMVELGEHAHTHIIPRLQKVIDGTDAGGVTAATGWQGGGGFRYARLAPSLLEKDKWGQYVISKQYNAAMLAEACCKIHGYTYAPSQSEFWRHGQSTERDFIYITTSYQTEAMLQDISEQVGPERTLLVLATAYDSAAERLENLTLKKIPRSILHKCDWGHDDYSLNVHNLPSAPQSMSEPERVESKPARGRKKAASSEPPPMLALMTEGEAEQ